MREVHRFRSYVVSGELDYFLSKPLFSSFSNSSWRKRHIGFTDLVGILLYIVLLLNAFLIALAFHIIVVALCVITTEIDNALWMYRDLTQMGRLPIDIYREPLRGILTFVIPVGIMITFPSRALMGLLSMQSILIALLIGVLLLYGSYKFWQYAIRHYSSASS